MPVAASGYRGVMATHFYTSSSLDGFIATPDHSLEWLFAHDFDLEGPMAYPSFIEGIGEYTGLGGTLVTSGDYAPLS